MVYRFKPMIIIGITGTLGAGKGTVVDYLVSQKGFRHYSVSGFLKTKLSQKGLAANRNNLQEIGNSLRQKYGPEFMVKKLLQEAKKQSSDAVIESIRNPKEAELVKKQENSLLMAVDAKSKIRYQRIKKRGGPKDKVSYQEFLSQERKELHSSDPNAQNLLRCISLADYKIINNSNLKSLYLKIEKIIKTKKKYIRPSWEDYFMEVADAISKRGTCDRGRSGCIIVKDNQILASGYVASPSKFPHCDDIGHQFKKMLHEDGTISEHCVRTVHAEQNAICQAAKKGIAIDGATVYVRMTPCRTCAMLLINCGIKQVYAERKYHDGAESEKMFKKAKIKIFFKHNELQKYANQKG